MQDAADVVANQIHFALAYRSGHKEIPVIH